ncbi:MAG TPA: GDSL-type esterase/lipase family protein [Rariglobus sp.]
MSISRFFRSLSCLIIAGSLALHATTKVVCDGDSITYGVGATNVDGTSYPALLRGLLGADYDVQKEGTSGSTMLKRGQVSYWYNTQGIQNTSAAQPNVITIMLGTNDTKDVNWAYGYEYADDYSAMLDLYEALPSHPRILMLLPPPCKPGEVNGSTISNRVIPRILAVARRHNIQVVDVHTPFLDGLDTLMVDGLHPNDAGYAVFAPVLRDAIIDGKGLFPVPAPWQRQDIGTVSVTGGDARTENGALHLFGTGTAIGGGADAFRYVYQSTSGNCSIGARVLGQRNLNPLVATQDTAAAGVMIRETLAPDSVQASVVVTPGNQVSFRYRTATGATANVTTASVTARPVSVRLDRSGDVFTAAYSLDGSVWISIGSAQTIPMSSHAYAGLAGNSGLTDELCTSRFDQVNITRQAGGLPGIPAQFTVTPQSGSVALSWTAAGGATGYLVKRATNANAGYSVVGTTSGTTFTDTNVSYNNAYYYVVCAANGSTESPYSDQAATMPPDAPTGLVAAASGSTQVNLSWSKRIGATAFRVKRATRSGGPYTVVATVSGTSCTDTGLVGGTSYYYVVSAINPLGESADSHEAAPPAYAVDGPSVTIDPDSSATRTLVGGAFETLFDSNHPNRVYTSDPASCRGLLGTFPGTSRGSVYFDGSRAMTGPRSNDLFVPGVDENVTIVAAVNIPVHSLASSGLIINISKSDTLACIGVGFDYGQNKFFATFPNSINGVNSTITAAHAIAPGGSHIVRLRKVGAALQLYVDGVQEADTTIARAPILAVGEGAPIAIGGLRSINPEFTGHLGKFCIYKGAPDATQAASLESDIGAWLGTTTAVLSASSVQGGAKLRWSKPATVSAVNIKRKAAPTENYTTIAAGVTQTEYTDTAVAASSSYYYVVAEVAAGVEVGVSNEVQVTTYSPLQTWRMTNGLPSDGTGIGADDYDATGGGVPNLLRYAFGVGAYDNASASLPRLEMDGSRLALHFQRDPSHTDIAYIVEASPDLSDGSWTTVAVSLHGEAMLGLDDATFVSETDDPVKNVVVELPPPPPGTTRQFMRLRISH